MYVLGAVLSQEVDGHEHSVAYASQTLFPAERKYRTTELELLSLVWATKYFRCYLLDREFKVITDHVALKWMLGLHHMSSRIMRWPLRLAEFNHTEEHKAGSKHTNADVLSRIMSKEIIPVIDLNALREHQQHVPQCRELRGKAFKISPEKILYLINGENKKIVVPETMELEVIRLNHDVPTAGHYAVAKTQEIIRETFSGKRR